ncbi:MAG: hypothetical protein M1G31_06475 [Pseudanabaena sp. Salubria-1]|nr:hypothetical protein [Pseudanabaena sp. Salubria-1]
MACLNLILGQQNHARIPYVSGQIVKRSRWSRQGKILRQERPRNVIEINRILIKRSFALIL